MTVKANLHIGILIAAGALLSACANGGDLSTASVSNPSTAQKSDPVCVSLANQIATIRGDGAIEKLEKAASGKTSKVEVKRATLQKQAELNRANADFQMRCGPQLPKQVAQASAPTAPAPAVTADATPPPAGSSN